MVKLPFCPVTKMSSYQNVQLPKCPVTKMSGYQNVRLPNCPVTKLSGYQIVGLPNCPVTKMLGTNNPPIGMWMYVDDKLSQINSRFKSFSTESCRHCACPPVSQKKNIFSRDCPDKPAGSDACRKCGEEGHMSRDCTLPDTCRLLFSIFNPLSHYTFLEESTCRISVFF